MGRKCSHCGNIGHNSRTCTNIRGATTCSSTVNFSCAPHGFKLFGVQVRREHISSEHISSLSATSVNAMNMMKKSFSMDCLPTSSGASSSSPSSSKISSLENDQISDHHKASNIGYLSDGLMCRAAQDRKKGVPWTEEEHRTFLMGLEKLGKGDWRGISRNYVTTRTPTQVASHAQKYFLRQATLTKKKRRSSLFDMFGSSTNIAKSDPTSTPPIPTRCLNNSTNPSHHHHLQHNNVHLQLSTTAAVQNVNSSDNHHIPADSGSHDHHDRSMPGWIHGLIDSQLKYSAKPSTCVNIPSSSSVVPDHLELTLAAPVRSSDMEQIRSSSSTSSPRAGPLLSIGPIRVT